jgi:arylsulfatase A-like enzyme
VWDGGHREPFVARWPGHIPAGAVSDDPVCLTDLLPTIATATGVEVPSGTAEDGVNALDVLRGTGHINADRPIVHHSLAGRFAIRSGQWKALFTEGSGGGFSEPTIGSLFSSGTGKAHTTPPWDAGHPDGQLYDMVVDPGERTNLWHERPDVVAALYGQLKEICGDERNGLPFDVPIVATTA